jgi:hypothetical protein
MPETRFPPSKSNSATIPRYASSRASRRRPALGTTVSNPSSHTPCESECKLLISLPTSTSGRSAFYHLPVTDDQDRAEGELTSYDGPTVAVRRVHDGNSWIWVANGSARSAFASPETVSLSARDHPVDVGHTRLSDRIIESFRIEVLDLGTYDPSFDELYEALEDVVVAADPDESGPENPAGLGTQVRVLGPVVVVGWKTRPERAIVTELTCFLALHRSRQVSGELLRVALRPEGTKEQSAKTVRTYVSLLRKALGPDALPASSSGGYQLSTNVMNRPGFDGDSGYWFPSTRSSDCRAA